MVKPTLFKETAAMARKIAFVLTSQRDLGTTGYPTGSWLEELSQPYWVFTDAGYEVTLASINGGEAPVDPMSLEDQWVSPAGKRLLADKDAQAKLAATPAVADLSSDDYDAIFMVGGAGVAWDFPGHAPLITLIETMERRDAVIGGVCHGALILAEAKGRDGQSLVRGRPVTAVSNAEEAAVGLDKIVPILPEEAMKRACAF
jgi:putative intracellular protease/amidase